MLEFFTRMWRKPVAALLPPADAAESDGVQVVSVHSLPQYQHVFQTGDKWQGGYGPTKLLTADYWTLRKRSIELFETSLHARGLIRRLVTNVINTGLHLESTPEEKILGKNEGDLADWSENTENRFALWGKDPLLCDHSERLTFGAIQAEAYREALLAGDVLVTIVQDKRTMLPRVKLIKGAAVQTPLHGKPSPGNKIVQGVELDANGRHVAYWVYQADGTSKRLPAWGEKSMRRLAWLVYGCDKQLDQTRGKPLLSIVLQSLKEIDRYRDSVQVKATVNAMLAMFVKKTQDKPATRVASGAGISRSMQPTVDSQGKARRFPIVEQHPGIVVEELQVGEEPVGFQSHGTDEKFADFESAIIRAIAWAHEIPPEILELSFGSNYSASQAAINEFKLFLNPVRTNFGDQFCQPIYEDWLFSQVLAQRLEADGFFQAWRNWSQYDVAAAWTSASWCGHIKPAVDMTKLVRGYTGLLEKGLITHDRAARELTGTKFSHNIRKLRIENQQLAEVNEVFVKQQQSARQAPAPAPATVPDDDASSNVKPTAERAEDVPAARGTPRAEA